MISNAPKPSKSAGSAKHVAPSDRPTAGPRSHRTGRALRRGDSADASPVASVSSTKAKASIHELIQRARHGPVFVTVHKKREAVVMSVDEYEQLLANQRNPLADMAEHFDALVAKMQTSEHTAAVDALFHATPEELGEAAVQATKNG